MASFYRSKQNAEAVNLIDTQIWICSNQSCKCWLRDEYSFSQKPICPMCQSSMINQTKALPQIVKANVY
ncbi:cold-inducible protein YdjO-related protein [Cohnella sp. WQ 127256]|uniref:cold-inducible protein YdjO-related protein n=1 Tax=Cohnella sp. WQ 127256 TaxID=2938790 RepID=UPI003558E0FE